MLVYVRNWLVDSLLAIHRARPVTGQALLQYAAKASTDTKNELTIKKLLVSWELLDAS